MSLSEAAPRGLPKFALTKAGPPPTNRSRVERKRLLDTLASNAGCRLILLRAPAGYGKTTLAVDWREMLGRSGAVTAWLSLDEGDNDPSAFAYHLSSALHWAAPELGQSAMGLLAEASLIAGKDVIATAINALIESDDEIYLFLDDYHVISDPGTHELAGYLLRYAPSNCHLVVMSRTDPPLQLSRLQLTDDIAEIDTSALRFTLQETGQFLANDLAPKLAESDVARLHRSTEGWPAALQLARVMVRSAADPRATAESFSGSSRQISAYIQETLATQTDEIVDFLLQTSILDQFNPALCEAVSGNPRSGEFLKALDHQQLLLVSLDEHEGWCRYHHLMGDYLRDRLRTNMPGSIPALHRRASEWFAAQKLWPQAVHHAVAARDVAMARALVRGCAMDLVNQGDLITLLSWERQLPPEVLQDLHDVKMAIAWGLALVTRFAEADALLSAVERSPDLQVDREA